jgi:hypothetical protein
VNGIGLRRIFTSPAGNTRERAKLPENPVSRLNDAYLDISDRREHGLQRDFRHWEELLRIGG